MAAAAAASAAPLDVIRANILELPVSPAPVPMLAVCASHISSPERLSTLTWMLESWAQQVRPVDMYLSVSWATDMAAEVESTLRDYEGEWGKKEGYFGPVLCVVRQTSVTAQFKHYEALALLLREDHATDTWLIFTDDDDLWHPERTFWYEHYIRVSLYKLGGDTRQLGFVSTRIYAEAMRGIDTKLIPSSSAGDVNVALARGSFHVEVTNSFGDYWEYAVPLAVLLQFLCHPRTEVLLPRKLADAYFVHFLRDCDKTHWVGFDIPSNAWPLDLGKVCWMYFYRLDMADRATRSMDPLPDELRNDPTLSLLRACGIRGMPPVIPEHEIAKYLYNMETHSAFLGPVEPPTFDEWMKHEPASTKEKYGPLGKCIVDYLWSSAYFKPLLGTPTLQ